jgi:hypothetical protein
MNQTTPAAKRITEPMTPAARVKAMSSRLLTA